MRVTSVTLLANEEEAIQMDLKNVNSKSRYLVRAIIGLDAEDIIPKFYGFGSSGKKFYDLSLKPKDVVLRIVLNPSFHVDEDYSDIRDKLYRIISASRTGKLELRLHSGAGLVAHIYGFITKFEVPYFSKISELQITLRCDDPMLRSLNPTRMIDNEFPTANPVIVADSTSTAPHGFAMKITFTSTSPTFTVQDKETDPEWKFQIIPATDFLAGDQLYFSSVFNDKYLYVVRSGVTTHLMDALDPVASVWPIIFPGFNSFWFPEIGTFDGDLIEFYTTYWGI